MYVCMHSMVHIIFVYIAQILNLVLKDYSNSIVINLKTCINSIYAFEYDLRKHVFNNVLFVYLFFPSFIHELFIKIVFSQDFFLKIFIALSLPYIIFQNIKENNSYF